MKKRLLLIIAIACFTLLGLNTSAYGQAASTLSNSEVQIKVYPNPTSRLVNLLFVTHELPSETVAVEIKVKNLLGQAMLAPINKKFSGSYKSYDLDLEKLPAGVYFLEVYTTIGEATLKQTKRITKNK